MGFRSAKLLAVDSDDVAASSTLRAFTLLEHLALADELPTLEELTRASGLPKH